MLIKCMKKITGIYNDAIGSIADGDSIIISKMERLSAIIRSKSI